MTGEPWTRVLVRGGEVLRSRDATPIRADLRVLGDRIVDIAPDLIPANDEVVVEAARALVAPGLIDLHGDAYERCLMPRGGVRVPLALALDDNDHQLLDCGITTAFLSATDSWEPGLRSRDTLRQLIEALASRPWPPRLLLHVRRERCQTAGFEELVGWVTSGAIGFLSFNDHTPGGIEMVKGISATQISRSGVTADELEAIQAAAITRRAQGAEQDNELAAAARSVGCRTASHDASSDADLARDLALGVAVAEFPLSSELAACYRDHGIKVLLGSPNLVRGGSHLGNLSVKDVWRPDVGDIICSDYHYPSLLQAPFVLEELGLADIGQAWDSVSGAPARAAGLEDRGELTEGRLADIVVVDRPRDGRPARARNVIVGGKVALAR